MAFGHANNAKAANQDLLAAGLTLKITGAAHDDILDALADIGQYQAVLGWAIETYLADPTDARFEHLEGIFHGTIDAEQWAKDEGWL